MLHSSYLRFTLSLWVLGVLSLILLAGCSSNSSSRAEEAATVSITKQAFGTLADGQTVEEYTLTNAEGMEVKVITYGGIITSWTAPDEKGDYQNVVLGFDNLDQYVDGNPYFGALIGRYGNRIAKGQFTLEETTYELATNNGENHLHGGIQGFDKVVWAAKESTTEDAAMLTLTYTSPDGEEGYPGELLTTVVYALTNDNELKISYEATTDKPTIVNLTQHTYFNLSGDFSRDILDHELSIDADLFIPVDETLIPTGELSEVAQTPFDFRTPKAIGQDIEAKHDQLSKGNGYDHCWVLNQQGSFRKVATAFHPGTGRYLEVFTDEPGVQFYCGNFLDGTLPAYGGGTYGHRSGFCLETQHYPDSPNQASFPSAELNPGETYRSTTTFQFSTKN